MAPSGAAAAVAGRLRATFLEIRTKIRKGGTYCRCSGIELVRAGRRGRHGWTRIAFGNAMTNVRAFHGTIPEMWARALKRAPAFGYTTSR